MAGKALAHGDSVRHRKSRKPAAAIAKTTVRPSATFGALHRLPLYEQVALLEMARAERAAQRELDRQDHKELDAFRVVRRKSNSELELESLIKQYALGLSFFDRYQQRGVKSVGAMQQALDGLCSDQAQLDWLREQIEMRVVGLGWVEFKSPWSSGKDDNVGSMSDLTGQLKDILEEEEDRE
eukprot:5999344-Prymnesium_polylepis.1